MAERSFAKEVQSLKLGDGEVFRGEGILAVTKALLQSGVAYVGGYQGAPISHLMDVFGDAQSILDELGVHFEVSASEAAAAAMLAASINYPLRGAVTWKSTVGTNVASDALSNLASAGVKGGALIILGEDYGEGASIMQERTHAFAMKSQTWLLDPRPNLPSLTRAVELGFELSEASNTPVMLEMRIRACHVYGQFVAKNNKRPPLTTREALEQPNRAADKIILPPFTFLQEQDKIERRWPAAVDFIQGHEMNELFDGDAKDVGIILQGGMYNFVVRALELLGLSDSFGVGRVPLYVLNVTYPLVESDIARFCADKQAVLVVEEGQPDFIEQALNQYLNRAGLGTKIVGKEVLPMAGEYTGAVVFEGISKFVRQWVPTLLDDGRKTTVTPTPDPGLQKTVPPRPPGLCTGCPERPLFTAVKLLQKELGPVHISADIGCHSFATLPPFNLGNSILGYGLGPAAASAFGSSTKNRSLTVMGDGGFWHNGLSSGITNAVFNQDDGVIIVVDNNYSAATGGQYIPSSRSSMTRRTVRRSIQNAVRGVGVNWVRTVRTYNIAKMLNTLREAMTTRAGGPKIIVAEGECQLNRQRRVKPLTAKMIAGGERVVKERFGVDADTCTGDHSCIRLSGCPSLTIKPNSDPLRKDPVAYVDNSCVGCGVCGSVAHAAVLCPSFYRAEIIFNPNIWDRLIGVLRRSIIGLLQRRSDRKREARVFS
ncbi:MAG: thiamine pyrophosphate-dependent enzyme [Gemmatimonadales bacterium]